ncbi:pyridoxamine 5'-phosphate oxidase [Aureitalea marina]|uniref:Pyridoxine/pyridoxamine 5'-phosphate oxidase n=1 Tax=Aureitalea marina TaxID=930804 RepID=A0A2S7KNV5_9FLAO|nr:pyridoxamine 5'-phosphate oxidase [Aureitalea marina]PQB04306.1 pyridoxamine 5'-phosphate oxidase [Aureitalea marina]
MQDNLYDKRQSYEGDQLDISSIDPNPMQQFRTWYYQVEEYGGVTEVNAMAVSTIGLDGYPKTRMVLLKKYDERGFVFYSNYRSEKGRSIDKNQEVCLSFFWPNLERQVIIKGIAKKAPKDESDHYFASRPRGSQLGALVSEQSQIVGSRKELEEELQRLEQHYENKDIPRPEHWGGYLVEPVEFEFWQGRPNRLHDRIRYRLDGIDWSIDRLSP